MGAGAVGCYFGGMLARAGAPVTLIGRQAHVDAIVREGLLLERAGGTERIAVPATTELGAVRDAEIVLFCVKTGDTESAAAALLPFLSPGSTVVSLQNGVDNVARIHAATGIRALAAVVYVAAAMAAPGHVKHSGRGDLVLGDLLDTGTDLPRLASLFEAAEIPCRISRDLAADLWTKMIMNCAYNAVSALGRARYGRVVHSAAARELMAQVVDEVIAVAAAAGVGLARDAMNAAVLRLGEAMSGAMSSTAQDIERGRRTEIESLNGFVVRRGAELGVAAPTNQALYALVRLLEEAE
jgi:2-dehydropantoate 2-reductase